MILPEVFDTVDHESPLPIKLLHYLVSIYGVALNWFRSFLAEKSQMVVINQCSSSPWDLSIRPLEVHLVALSFQFFKRLVSEICSASFYHLTQTPQSQLFPSVCLQLGNGWE